MQELPLVKESVPPIELGIYSRWSNISSETLPWSTFNIEEPVQAGFFDQKELTLAASAEEFLVQQEP